MVLLAFLQVSLASDHIQLNKYMLLLISFKHNYIRKEYTLQCTVSCNMILSHDLCLPIAALHRVLLANVCTTARCISSQPFVFHSRVADEGGAADIPQRKQPRSSGLCGDPNSSCNRRTW